MTDDIDRADVVADALQGLRIQARADVVQHQLVETDGPRSSILVSRHRPRGKNVA